MHSAASIDLRNSYRSCRKTPSAAADERYKAPCRNNMALAGLFAARQDQGAQQSDQNQKRRQLKREYVFAEEQRRKVARRYGFRWRRSQVRRGPTYPIGPFRQEHNTERHAPK